MWQKGRKCSKEHKKKMSEGRLRYFREHPEAKEALRKPTPKRGTKLQNLLVDMAEEKKEAGKERKRIRWERKEGKTVKIR